MRLVWRLWVIFQFEEVEERVCRVRVMPTERLQAVLPVHEDDGVARPEKVLCGRRTTCS